MRKSITIEVVGNQRIVCEGCEERIEGALKRLPGIEKVRARARSQRVEVLFDDAAVNAAAIAERLAEAGYETRLAG